MATASDVLNVARGEIGYSRWNDPEAGTKYGRWYAAKTGQSWYGGNGVAYCAMFVSWVFDQAGAAAPGLPGAYCPSMLAKGGTVAKKSAQPGDIVYFDWGGDGVADHVGIIEQNNGSYVTTIEGNTSNGSSGSQSNGGCVARRTRSWGVIKAIVRPTWGAATNKEDEVTDADIEKIASKVYDKMQGAAGCLLYKNESVNGNADTYKLLTETYNATKDNGHGIWSYTNAKVRDRDIYGIITDMADEMDELKAAIAKLSKE
jgi:hypothetical protein